MKLKFKQYALLFTLFVMLFTISFKAADIQTMSGYEPVKVYAEEQDGETGEPSEPVASADAVESEAPAESAEPQESAEPTEPSAPAESSEPTSSEEPAESAAPTPRPIPSRARYVLRHSTKTEAVGEYKLDLFLVADEYISTGTFGIEYDPMVLPNFIDEGPTVTNPTFELNTDYFSEFRRYRVDNTSYFVYSWTMYEGADKFCDNTDGLLIGTITVPNVTLEPAEDGSGNLVPQGWHTRTFRQLDWYTTTTSTEPMYTNNAGGVCLNDEIYNDETKWYQGLSFGEDVKRPEDINPPRPNDPDPNRQWQWWIDIGFVVDIPGLPVRDDRIIQGKITSYNPNNPTNIELVDSAGTDVILNGNAQVVWGPTPSPKADDSYTWAYSITLGQSVQPDDYTLRFSKEVHLTYNTKIKVENSMSDPVTRDVELYCGDIGGKVDDEGNVKGDENIKLNDRVLLMRDLNRRTLLEPRSDLNGDGRVTIHDLNILIRYFNRSYTYPYAVNKRR